MRTIKCVFLGDTQVGKTCILSKFVNDSIDNNGPSTIGASYLTKIVSTPKGQVRLQLWDTAGQEKYRTLNPMYYRSAAVAILVFDVTNKESFEKVESWAHEITSQNLPNIILVLIGNKIDLYNQRTVSTGIGEAMAQSINAKHYFETSAVTGQGIYNLFLKISELDIQSDANTENRHLTEFQTSNQSGCC